MKKTKRIMVWLLAVVMIFVSVGFPDNRAEAATTIDTINVFFDFNSIQVNTDEYEYKVDERVKDSNSVTLKSEGFTVNHQGCGLYYMRPCGQFAGASTDHYFRVRYVRTYFYRVQLDLKTGYSLDNNVISKIKTANEKNENLSFNDISSDLVVKRNNGKGIEGYITADFNKSGGVVSLILYFKATTFLGDIPIEEPARTITSEIKIIYENSEVTLKDTYHDYYRGTAELGTIENKNGTLSFKKGSDSENASGTEKYYMRCELCPYDEDYSLWTEETMKISGLVGLDTFKKFKVYVNGQVRTDGYLSLDREQTRLNVYFPVENRGLLSWKSDGTGWWAEDSSGWYPTSQWQKIDGKWYYFCADGYMDYSEYRDGCWLGSDGAWVESYYGGHWESDATGWWYADASGWYPVSQYVWIDGVNYWFGASGYWE